MAGPSGPSARWPVVCSQLRGTVGSDRGGARSTAVLPSPRREQRRQHPFTVVRVQEGWRSTRALRAIPRAVQPLTRSTAPRTQMNADVRASASHTTASRSSIGSSEDAAPPLVVTVAVLSLQGPAARASRGPGAAVGSWVAARDQFAGVAHDEVCVTHVLGTFAHGIDAVPGTLERLQRAFGARRPRRPPDRVVAFGAMPPTSQRGSATARAGSWLQVERDAPGSSR